MSQTCKACASPLLAEIDAAITRGEPNRRIAARVGCAESSIRRHAAHVPETVALAVQAAEATRADDLLAILREGVRDARRLRDRAEAEGDLRCAVAAVKTLCDIVEKLADIGERLAKSGEAEPLRVEWVNDWRAPGGPGRGTDPDA